MPVVADYSIEIEDVCARFDWQKIFGNDSPVELDLGAGDGGFAIAYAQQHPSSACSAASAKSRSAPRVPSWPTCARCASNSATP
jgi:tRNA G46 methylase TrmB